MTIAGAIFLIAVGAILRFATNVHVQGVSLDTVGLILMIAGAAGLVLSYSRRRSGRAGRGVAKPPLRSSGRCPKNAAKSASRGATRRPRGKARGSGSPRASDLTTQAYVAEGTAQPRSADGSARRTCGSSRRAPAWAASMKPATSGP